LAGRDLPVLPAVRLPFFVFLSPFPIVWIVKGLVKCIGGAIRRILRSCSNSQPVFVNNHVALSMMFARRSSSAPTVRSTTDHFISDPFVG
jgi:hypothetical protein